MKSKHQFYTRTLANLYLAQGYQKEAEAAYVSLLDKAPGREDCLSVLGDIKKIKIDNKEKGVTNLIAIWTDLLRKEQKIFSCLEKGDDA